MNTSMRRPLVAYLGAWEGFEALRDVVGARAETMNVAPNAEALTTALAGADALLDASMRVKITDAMIAGAPRLRIIACATTGSDHIARGELSARGIPVRTLKENPDLLRNITPAAELSWALLMACARKLVAAVEHVRTGKWVREEFPGLMLHGKQLGLIGCGRIGGWMARYAQAFGMRVVGHDPHAADLPAGVTRVPLERLFADSDFVSIHVHLTDETRGLVSRDLLGRIKRGAVLINTSRGAIVDEAALLDALNSGQVGAAGLDVLEGEPEIDAHPLVGYARHHDNLLITPHCGGFSPDAVRLVCRHAALKILEALGPAHG